MKNLHLYISKVVTTLSTLLFNIYLAKVTDVAYFGIFSLFLNLCFLFNLINDWGLPTYGPLEINQYNSTADKQQYLKTIINFKMVVTVITAVAYTFIIALLYQQHFFLLIFGVLVIVANLFNLDWVLRAYQHFVIVSVRQILNAVLNLLFVLVIYFFKLRVEYVFLTYALSLMFSFLVGIFFMYKKGIIHFPSDTIKKCILDFWGIVVKTKSAFSGLLVFNLLYTLNFPLLTYFSSNKVTSAYASYYLILSSILAVVAIAQDIFLPKYNVKNQVSFFKAYQKIIFTGSTCVVIILCMMPFIFKYIYPKSFIVNIHMVILTALLGLMYSYRLIYVQAYLIKNQYKYFLVLNAIGIVTYLLVTSFFIATNNYNEVTALLALVVAEIIVVVISIVQQNFINTALLLNILVAASIITYTLFFYTFFLSVFIYSIALLIAAIIFYKFLTSNSILHETD